MVRTCLHLVWVRQSCVLMWLEADRVAWRKLFRHILILFFWLLLLDKDLFELSLLYTPVEVNYRIRLLINVITGARGFLVFQNSITENVSNRKVLWFFVFKRLILVVGPVSRECLINHSVALIISNRMVYRRGSLVSFVGCNHLSQRQLGRHRQLVVHNNTKRGCIFVPR